MLQSQGIEHEVIDLTQHREAYEHCLAMCLALPIIEDGDNIYTWDGAWITQSKTC
jgi:hypothetical protein